VSRLVKTAEPSILGFRVGQASKPVNLLQAYEVGRTAEPASTVIWSCPDLVDSLLSGPELFLEFRGSLVAQGRVTSLSIVEDLDVVEDILSSLSPG
jgi:hypothetical protein